ncbi:MAG: tetratricopeptide repeat protein [Bacteroidales bacterium]|nr:tetratricopeptide repeat protein [Bacteroidales bacterium]
MKKILAILSFIILCGSCCLASTEQLKQANELYANGNYAEAAEIYNTLLEENESADLYYNYGNALYKQGELGKAILNYERALRLNPRHADAKFNLDFVNQQITDRIDANSTFFLNTFFRKLSRSLPADTWGTLSVACFLLMLVAFFLYVFGHAITLRKIAFTISAICLFFVIVFGIFAQHQKRYIEQRVEAIVMTGSVTVKSSPDESGTEIFVLHEGTKVERQDALGTWSKIKIADGQVGWLPTSTIQPI